MNATDPTPALEAAAADTGRRTVTDIADAHYLEIGGQLGTPQLADTFLDVLHRELARTPELYDCDPYSVIGAVRLAVQLDLDPGPLDHVYLVPDAGVCRFALGYVGLVRLATRTGEVRSIDAGIVREGDAFAYRYGTRPFLDHTPDGDTSADDWAAAYAVATLKSGGKLFDVLTPDRVELRRDASPAHTAQASPWITRLGAMWRKAAVTQLCDRLPQSPELVAGLDADIAGWVPSGLATEADPGGISEVAE